MAACAHLSQLVGSLIPRCQWESGGWFRHVSPICACHQAQGMQPSSLMVWAALAAYLILSPASVVLDPLGHMAPALTSSASR